jgi:hypothetical protein
MSSTNRGYSRHVADYYVTPQKPIKEFLNLFLYDEDISRPDRMKWLDPCCGGDENNEPSYANVIKRNFEPREIVTMDIREDSHADIKGDFLLHDIQNEQDKPDILISNPPFYLAEEFIRKGLSLVSEGGYVIMLLRLNFFGSAQRKPFFEENMPKSCYIHHKRINFIPDSMKTQMKANGDKVPSGDSIEYAHFVWQKGYEENYCKTFVI